MAGAVAPAFRLLERRGHWPGLFRAVMARTLPPPGGFGDYLPDEHDVVVATYEKSGTNWLLQIVHQIATLGHGSFPHVHDVAPWPDGPPDRVAAVRLETPTWRDTATGQRPVKTHLPRSRAPLTDAARYVVVVRDPKDVVVSSWHFTREVLLGPLMPSCATWAEVFLGEDGFGQVRGGPWPAHVDGWWRERHRPNVLVLRYEDMLADLDAAVLAVAGLMEVDLDDEAVARVCDHSTFAAMRRISDRFDLQPFTPLGEAGARIVRTGGSGGAEALLTSEQRRRIDDHCERELARLGSDFPYREMYARA